MIGIRYNQSFSSNLIDVWLVQEEGEMITAICTDVDTNKWETVEPYMPNNIEPTFQFPRSSLKGLANMLYELGIKS